jgi:hypothetical protein
MTDRREALRLLGLATAAVSFIGWDPDELIAGIHEHATRVGTGPQPLRKAAGPYTFRTLDARQRETVAELSEMIIPATDTPGAKAAKVDEFIDIILTEWSTDGEKAEFLAGLAACDVRATQAFGAPFVRCTAAQRARLLTEMDAELTAARTARRAWRRDSGQPQPPDHRKLFFHQVRSLTVSGYYSSEPGYKLERKQSIIPGIYTACMPAGEASR